MSLGKIASLIGFDTLLSKLKGGGKELEKDESPSHLDRVAQRVLTDAKKGAPVDTGALRASGRVEAPNKKTRVVAFGGRGTGVDYAPAVEFGSAARAPNPFLRRALMKNLAYIKKSGVEAVNRVFKK